MQNNSKAVGGKLPTSRHGVVSDASDTAGAGGAGGAGAQASTLGAGAARTPSPARNPGVLAGPPPLRRTAPPAQWLSAHGGAPLPAGMPALRPGPRAEGDPPTLVRRRETAAPAPTFGLTSPSALSASRDAAADADTDADAEVAYFNEHLADPPAALAPES